MRIGSGPYSLAVLAAFAPSPGPFVALMFLGFLVGIGGHVYGSRTTVAAGIALIFLATLGLPLALYAGSR